MSDTNFFLIPVSDIIFLVGIWCQTSFPFKRWPVLTHSTVARSTLGLCALRCGLRIQVAAVFVDEFARDHVDFFTADMRVPHKALVVGPMHERHVFARALMQGHDGQPPRGRVTRASCGYR